MAALKYNINIPSKSLTTADQTVAFIKAPTNQRVKILGIGLFMDGTLNSAQPIQWALGWSSGGTLTTGTPVLSEQELVGIITPQATVGVAASVEPGYTPYKTGTVHPQLGYEVLLPLGDEDVVGAGKTWVLKMNPPATVDVRGYIHVEEG